MILAFIIIFAISLILAYRSMSDWGVPKEIRRIVSRRKLRGSIVIFKNKVKHYRS